VSTKETPVLSGAPHWSTSKPRPPHKAYLCVCVCSVGRVDYIDLRSTTSQTLDVDQSNAGDERQRMMVSAGGAKQTSYPSRSVERFFSSFRMPSGHHQQSYLSSRLESTGSRPPPYTCMQTEVRD